MKKKQDPSLEVSYIRVLLFLPLFGKVEIGRWGGFKIKRWEDFQVYVLGEGTEREKP